MGIKLAIATSDDRAPTQAMIRAFQIEEFLAAMVLAICERLHMSPHQVMLVADTTADLRMGRAAGVGMVVGTLSGVSDANDLAPFADVLIESIDDLRSYIPELARPKLDYRPEGLNFDPIP
jgi:phosphoglycolate phosphatase